MREIRLIIGSGLYNCVFIGWTAVSVTIMTLFLPFPRPVMQRAVKTWAWSQHWALKLLVGLNFEIRGSENIVNGAAIYSCKHQSAWDTYFFYLLFSDPSYVLKKELVRIPVWGWMARKCAAISIDRDGGIRALKTLVREVKQRLSDNRPVIIFPEGTRTQPGVQQPYHPGISALYLQCDAPVIPVALNSGLFWGRRSYRKEAGRIVIEFLPAISPGMKRKPFMEALERAIEDASLRLAEEGIERYPHTRSAWAGGREDATGATHSAERTVD